MRVGGGAQQGGSGCHFNAIQWNNHLKSFSLKKKKSCVSFKLAVHVMETCLEKSVGAVTKTKNKKQKNRSSLVKIFGFFFTVPCSWKHLGLFFYPRRQHSLSRQGHQTCRLPKHPILDGVLDDFTPSAPLPLPSLTPSSFLLLPPPSSSSSLLQTT